MNEFALKYGCNPNQKPSRIYMDNSTSLPIEVLNGKPGYINFLDALNGWQLVSELKPKEQQLITMRYFKGATQMKVADMLGISQVQVSRMEKRILDDMRTKMAE